MMQLLDGLLDVMVRILIILIVSMLFPAIWWWRHREAVRE